MQVVHFVENLILEYALIPEW